MVKSWNLREFNIELVLILKGSIEWCGWQLLGRGNWLFEEAEEIFFFLVDSSIFLLIKGFIENVFFFFSIFFGSFEIFIVGENCCWILIFQQHDLLINKDLSFFFLLCPLIWFENVQLRILHLAASQIRSFKLLAWGSGAD